MAGKGKVFDKIAGKRNEPVVSESELVDKKRDNQDPQKNIEGKTEYVDQNIDWKTALRAKRE